MDERTGHVIVAVMLIVLAIPAGVAVAQDLSTHTASAGNVYETNNGLEVQLTTTEEISKTPFDGNQTVQLTKTSFSSAGSGRVEINNFGNVSSETFAQYTITTSGNPITITDAETQPVTVSGGVDQLSVGEAVVDDGRADFALEASGPVTLSVENMQNVSTGVKLVDSNGNDVDGVTSAPGGDAEFEIPAGSYSGLRLQTGPSELRLHDETQPGALLDVNGTIEVRFFVQNSDEQQTEVITRKATNGTVSMIGLPADKRLIASTNVDGYFQRSIAIQSILNQQDLYMLPETQDASQVDWVLDDESGDFPATETTLYVERALEVNGTTQWRVIVGERFGATERIATTLKTGDRYRLRVRSEAGDVRVLGSYTAAGPAQEPLRIGQVNFPGADDTGAALSTNVDTDDGMFEYRYNDPQGRTQKLNVTVVRNSDGQVVYNDTVEGPVSTTRERIPLSQLGHTDDESYRVEYRADRGTAGVYNGDRQVGDLPDIAKNWNLDPRLLNLFGYITVIAIFGATVILSARHAGIVASTVAMGLSLIGVLQISQILIGFAFVVSGLFAVGGRR